MAAIKARKCFVPRSPSDWVAKVFLTCDNMIAVQFKHGEKVKKILAHGPGAYLGYGGVPAVCCLYPGTQGALAETLYELAQVWPFAGEWVHAFLYKKFGYVRVSPPQTCGGCNTSCSLTANPAAPTNGQAVTLSCTVTNNDGSTTKGDAPKGSVTFSVDGTSIGTVTLPDNEPDTQNFQTVTLNWTATCNPQATHNLEAVYTPAEADFTSTTCSASLTVSGCQGVATSCCPSNDIPQTLHATISNVSNCGCMAGTYPLNYNGSRWQSAAYSLCGISVSFFLDCFFESGAYYLRFGSFNNATGGYDINPQTASSYSCSPFQAYFGNEFAASCGNINVTVTT
jgi:hypothetical protein